jgi:hypothetical protein
MTKREFSKQIVLWAISLTTIYIITAMFGFGNDSLSDLVGLIVTGVIVSYMGKSGVENFQKIRNAKGENEI